MFNRISRIITFSYKNFLPFLIIPLNIKLYMSTKAKSENKLHCNNTVESLDKLDKKLDKLIEKRTKTKTQIDSYIPINICNPCLKRLINHETYRKYFKLRTKEGFTIDDIIQPAIDSYNNTDDKTSAFENCLIAPSKDSFYKFHSLYESYFKLLFPQEDLNKKFENESYSMVKSLLMGMEEIIEKFFIEVDFTANRNLDNFLFTPKINRGERKNVKEILRKAIINSEKEIFNKEGNFLKMKNDLKSYSGVFNSNNELLKAAGVYRDWPQDRLIYFNCNSNFICLINEEDHLKVKINSIDSKEIKNLIQNFYEFLEQMEKNEEFAVHDKFGFLNANSVNVGTATYFTVKLKITQDLQRHEELIKKFEESKKDLNVELKTETGFYYLTINNLNPFYTFSTLLIELLNIKDFLK